MNHDGIYLVMILVLTAGSVAFGAYQLHVGKKCGRKEGYNCAVNKLSLEYSRSLNWYNNASDYKKAMDSMGADRKPYWRGIQDSIVYLAENKPCDH